MKTDFVKEKNRVPELTFQQKLWKGGQILLWSLKPLILYLCLPALFMCAGMFLFGGRSAGTVVSRSGNFYYALGITATVIVLYRRSKKRGTSLWEESALELTGLSWKRLALLGVTGLGLALFVSAVITIVPFPESLMDSYRDSSDGLRNGTDLALAAVSTVFLAPAAEEIVFRGYMLGRLLTGFTQRQAIWISAAVFALCHVSLLWMIYACLMGAFLAWVSIREDNLAYSVALHMGFNASIVPVSLINGRGAWKQMIFGSSFRVALTGVLALFLFVSC